MSHLLLVDDNADHLFLTRRALRSSGIESTAVQTAEAAMEAFSSGTYDMIVLDQNLPGMKGSELIGNIRALGIDTPVIMVTGGGSEQLAVDALKSGALDYIVKSDGYLTTLPTRIQRAIAQHHLELANRKLEVERQAAVERIEEHARRLRSLQQASHRINSSLQPRDVRAEAVQQAASLLDTEMAAFFLISVDRLSLQIVASHGLSADFVENTHVRVGEAAIGKAVLKGEPVAVVDVMADDRFDAYGDMFRTEGCRSILSVPLLMRGDAQGGLSVIDRAPRQWEAEEIAILQTLAQNVAIAYENAELYDRLASRVTELQTLNRIVTSLTTSSDLEQALNAAVSNLRELTGAVAGAIIMRETEGVFRLCGTGDLPQPFQDAIYMMHALGVEGDDDLPIAPDLRAIRLRQVELLTDVRADERLHSFRDMAEQLGFNSIISVPLIPRDEPIGAFSLFFEYHRRMDRQEQQILETVANAVAVAVQRALLQENLLREEAERLALSESGRMKTEFISMVSHEFRTPLTSIEGYVQLILRGHCGAVDPVQREFLETVARNSHRLSNLVDDLLDISRIESGTLLLERKPLSLCEVVLDCVQMIADQAEARQMPMQLNLPEDLPQITGDSQRLGEVVTNFLSNAIKYGKEGNPVEITVRYEAEEKPPQVVVSVRDHGAGIAPEEIPKLFQKFYRVDNPTTRTISGTGLGLAIAKHLVELHGGKIGVESELNAGSIFYFSVPVIQGATHAKDNGSG